MFKPDWYNLEAWHVGWVFNMPEKKQEKACKIWLKRIDKLDAVALSEYPHSYRYEKANSLWEELYMRCAAIKYPELVKGMTWPEEKDAYLLTSPRGTIVAVQNGHHVAIHKGNDPLCISPDFEYEIR